MYKKIIFFATALAFILVMLGAFVRLSDAGLGCPDWPGCYGRLIAPHSSDSLRSLTQAFPENNVEPAKAWKEMIHRYIAGILGLLIVAITILAWKNHLQRRESPWLASCLIVLVIFQAALGMWTVTLLLKPVIVTLHLLGGLATLSLLCWLSLKQADTIHRNYYKPVFRCFAWFTLLAIVGQIILGGWVSANYAALGCQGFPTCNSEWIPTMDFNHAFHLTRELGKTVSGELLSRESLTAIHWTHRLGAAFLLMVVGGFALACLTKRELRRYGSILLFLLLAQIGLGITNVLANLPLAVAVAHNGVAALLLMTMVMLNFKICSPRFE